jgi:hypothetical protein
MAKSTPVPDMNEPVPEAQLADATITIPDAVAGLPPSEPSVTTAPDGTLVVTTTEVESSNATISVAEPDPVREQLGEDLAADRTAGDLTHEIVSDVAALGRKILAAGEHEVQAVRAMPRWLDEVILLPLADEFETLHEVEGLVISSFMDVGNVVRKVYLNVLGHFVKA